MSHSWTGHGRERFPFDNSEIAKYQSRRREVEQQHKRELVAAEPSVHPLATWDGDLTDRRLRVTDGELSVELFATPSTTQRLYVFLSAGGGAKKTGNPPDFPRVSWHPWVDGVCVNIDDPTFAAFPGRLQTGWYVGTRRQDAMTTIARMLGRVQGRYQIRTEDVFIIGSSAGGTAALKLAAAVPGATAIAENPPVYPHEQSSIKYLLRAGLDIRSGDLRDRNSLRGIIDHETSRFFILQNAEDGAVVGQLRRFLEECGLPLPGVGLSQIGSLSVYFTSVPTLSPHHAFLSVGDFLSVLRVVSRSSSPQTRAMVLDAVHESLRGRALAADKASNMQGWIRLFSELAVTALAPLPLPSDRSVVRLPLESCPAVSYRLRLGHQAKHVFMAVDLKAETVEKFATKIDDLVPALGAKLTENANGKTVSISGVPLEAAAEKLRSLVDSTAPLFQ